MAWAFLPLDAKRWKTWRDFGDNNPKIQTDPSSSKLDDPPVRSGSNRNVEIIAERIGEEKEHIKKNNKNNVFPCNSPLFSGL